MRSIRVHRWVVLVSGLIFLAYGIAFILAPEATAMMVTGESPQTTTGMIDMRATYGGLSTAVGVVLLMMGVSRTGPKQGLVTMLLVMLGMAGGRFYGIVTDGSPGLSMYFYLIFEVAVAVAVGWMLFLSPRGSRQ